MSLLQTILDKTAPATPLYAAGKGYGYGLETWPSIDEVSIHAAYFFGNGQSMADADHYDYSFHQRRLTQTGSPTLGSGFVTPDASNYYETPFSDTDILAAGTPNEWTFCCVAKGNGAADGTLFSAEHPFDQGGFRAWVSTSGTLSPHQYDADGPSGSANPQITGSANVWTFFAVSFSAGQVKAYRKSSATAMLTAVATPSPVGIVASGRNFMIGRRTPNTSQAGGLSMCTAAFYNRVITPTEMDGLYATAKAFLAPKSYGILL